MVQVSIEYLTAFTRLERTTNVLVCVAQEDLDTLRLLVYLCSLCVEVSGTTMPKYCAKQLEDIFRVQDKRDGQLFKVLSPYKDLLVVYHNSHCIVGRKALAPAGFTYSDDGVFCPRPYLDLLQSARPYLDDRLGRVVDIVLKHRGFGWKTLILKHVAQQLGDRFVDLVDIHMGDFAPKVDEVPAYTSVLIGLPESIYLPWNLLHYFDIPDRPKDYTREEISYVESVLFPDT